uniref:Ubiquitin-like domain-containing protein n=1 Tax=Kalanchoe fedtschenkoi TaxID=63787 RepID=A0A7N0UTE1_KALFE
MLYVEDVGWASLDYLGCRPPKQCAASSLVADGIVARRRSFSYSKLRQEPLSLTVLKLDASSFQIEVRNGATVGELKAAVQNYFSVYVPGLGSGKVSWPHVWGQFCLSYDGRKLLDEKAYLRDFGIKDGDQLQFVRHASRGGSAVIKPRSSQKQASVTSGRHPRIMTKGNNDTREDKLESKLDKLNNNQQQQDDNDDNDHGDDTHFLAEEENETARRSTAVAVAAQGGGPSETICRKFRKIFRLYTARKKKP